MLSIITPTYNCASFLLRSYKSLLNQTVNNWEWIIVNDGSDDATFDILSNMAKSDTRIKFFNLQKNQGRGYARNFAIEKSSGDILVIWDVDDLYLSTRLWEIDNAIKSGYDFFVSHTLVVDNDRNIKGARHFSNKKSLFYPSFVHPTLAFRSDLKDRISYDISMRAGEDLGVMILLENSFYGFYSEKYLLVYFEDREINISKSIESNINQYKTILKIKSNKIIKFNNIDLIKFIIFKKIKIGIMRILSFFPNIYLSTVKFRELEKIISKNITDEHLTILNGNNEHG